MAQHDLVTVTAAYVEREMTSNEGSHDWFHVWRVWQAAKTIGAAEGVDMLVVELGALLHDIGDAKFHDGDETVGPKMAGHFLKSHGADSSLIEHIQQIIANISFRGGSHEQQFRSAELDVIQDADRLDALGAIGIARTFAYGGYRQREIYNPAIEPRPGMSKEEYMNNNGPSINHFYEKLLLLKERMNTDTGKKMAEKRHQFMVDYLQTFYREWNGEE